MQSYSRILIIKPSSLGDIVHALPAVMALRRVLPAAKITWLVRNQFAPLLECVNGINQRLLFDRNAMARWYYKPSHFKCLRDFQRQLKEGRFDLVIDLQGLFRSGYFAWLTGCKNRIGLAEAREGARFFYTQIVRQPEDSSHIVDYYFAVLGQLGISTADLEFGLRAPADACGTINEKMFKLGLKERQFLILVPSSAHAAKCWPAERFARAAELLHEQYQLALVAVGTNQDKEITKRIQKDCKYPIIDLSGQTNLKELLALFVQAAAVISNDTGPGHMAAALNVPTVIIFGHTNPLRLGPYKKPECVAAIDPQHRGRAIDDPNPAYHITNVTVEMVMARMNSQLSGS